MSYWSKENKNKLAGTGSEKPDQLNDSKKSSDTTKAAAIPKLPNISDTEILNPEDTSRLDHLSRHTDLSKNTGLLKNSDLSKHSVAYEINETISDQEINEIRAIRENSKKILTELRSSLVNLSRVDQTEFTKEKQEESFKTREQLIALSQAVSKEVIKKGILTQKEVEEIFHDAAQTAIKNYKKDELRGELRSSDPSKSSGLLDKTVEIKKDIDFQSRKIPLDIAEGLTYWLGVPIATVFVGSEKSSTVLDTVREGRNKYLSGLAGKSILGAEGEFGSSSMRQSMIDSNPLVQAGAGIGEMLGKGHEILTISQQAVFNARLYIETGGKVQINNQEYQALLKSDPLLKNSERLLYAGEFVGGLALSGGVGNLSRIQLLRNAGVAIGMSGTSAVANELYHSGNGNSITLDNVKNVLDNTLAGASQSTIFSGAASSLTKYSAGVLAATKIPSKVLLGVNINKLAKQIGGNLGDILDKLDATSDISSLNQMFEGAVTTTQLLASLMQAGVSGVDSVDVKLSQKKSEQGRNKETVDQKSTSAADTAREVNAIVGFINDQAVPPIISDVGADFNAAAENRQGERTSPLFRLGKHLGNYIYTYKNHPEIPDGEVRIKSFYQGENLVEFRDSINDILKTENSELKHIVVVSDSLFREVVREEFQKQGKDPALADKTDGFSYTGGSTKLDQIIPPNSIVIREGVDKEKVPALIAHELSHLVNREGELGARLAEQNQLRRQNLGANFPNETASMLVQQLERELKGAGYTDQEIENSASFAAKITYTTKEDVLLEIIRGIIPRADKVKLVHKVMEFSITDGIELAKRAGITKSEFVDGLVAPERGSKNLNILSPIATELRVRKAEGPLDEEAESLLAVIEARQKLLSDRKNDPAFRNEAHAASTYQFSEEGKRISSEIEKYYSSIIKISDYKDGNYYRDKKRSRYKNAEDLLLSWNDVMNGLYYSGPVRDMLVAKIKETTGGVPDNATFAEVIEARLASFGNQNQVIGKNIITRWYSNNLVPKQEIEFLCTCLGIILNESDRAVLENSQYFPFHEIEKIKKMGVVEQLISDLNTDLRRSGKKAVLDPVNGTIAVVPDESIDRFAKEVSHEAKIDEALNGISLEDACIKSVFVSEDSIFYELIDSKKNSFGSRYFVRSRNGKLETLQAGTGELQITGDRFYVGVSPDKYISNIMPNMPPNRTINQLGDSIYFQKNGNLYLVDRNGRVKIFNKVVFYDTTGEEIFFITEEPGKSRIYFGYPDTHNYVDHEAPDDFIETAKKGHVSYAKNDSRFLVAAGSKLYMEGQVFDFKDRIVAVQLDDDNNWYVVTRDNNGVITLFKNGLDNTRFDNAIGIKGDLSSRNNIHISASGHIYLKFGSIQVVDEVSGELVGASGYAIVSKDFTDVKKFIAESRIYELGEAEEIDSWATKNGYRSTIDSDRKTTLYKEDLPLYRGDDPKLRLYTDVYLICDYCERDGKYLLKNIIYNGKSREIQPNEDFKIFKSKEEPLYGISNTHSKKAQLYYGLNPVGEPFDQILNANEFVRGGKRAINAVGVRNGKVVFERWHVVDQEKSQSSDEYHIKTTSQLVQMIYNPDPLVISHELRNVRGNQVEIDRENNLIFYTAKLIKQLRSNPMGLLNSIRLTPNNKQVDAVVNFIAGENRQAVADQIDKVLFGGTREILSSEYEDKINDRKRIASGDGDLASQENTPVVLSFQNKVSGLFATGYHIGYDKESNSFKRGAFAATSDYKTKRETAVLNNPKGGEEIVLPVAIGGRLVADRVVAKLKNGKEVILKPQTDAVGVSTVVVPMDAATIKYSQEIPLSRPIPETVSKEKYDKLAAEFKAQHDLPKERIVQSFPIEIRRFLADIRQLDPKKQIIEIEKFLREFGYYDTKNKDVKDKTVDFSPEERIKFMFERMAEIREEATRSGEDVKKYDGKMFAGVCADYGLMAMAMMDYLGIVSGYCSGYQATNEKEVKAGYRHGITYALFPNSNNTKLSVIIPVDGTPSSEDKNVEERLQSLRLRTIEEEENHIVEEKAAYERRIREEKVEVVGTVSNFDRAKIESLTNGELEKLVNRMLEQITLVDSKRISTVFGWARYSTYANVTTGAEYTDNGEVVKIPPKIQLVEVYKINSGSREALEFRDAYVNEGRFNDNFKRESESSGRQKFIEDINFYLDRYTEYFNGDRSKAIAQLEEMFNSFQAPEVDFARNSALLYLKYLRAFGQGNR